MIQWDWATCLGVFTSVITSWLAVRYFLINEPIYLQTTKAKHSWKSIKLLDRVRRGRKDTQSDNITTILHCRHASVHNVKSFWHPQGSSATTVEYVHILVVSIKQKRPYDAKISTTKTTSQWESRNINGYAVISHRIKSAFIATKSWMSTMPPD